MRLVLWDLDNCLSNDEWRLRYIDRAKPPETRHEAYHRLCFRDEPGNREAFFAAEGRGLSPMFVTGRPESARGLTMAWLHYHFDIAAPMLLMRGNGDHRPAVDVKCEALAGALSRFSNSRRSATIEEAYDDDAEIVSMYAAVFNITNARILRIYEEKKHEHE